MYAPIDPLTHIHTYTCNRYESVVREKEDLRSRLDLSGSGPLTEQKYQVCFSIDVHVYVCMYIPMYMHACMHALTPKQPPSPTPPPNKHETKTKQNRT